MKRLGHLFWTFIYIFIITFLIEPLALVLIFIVVFTGLFPDLDYGDNHRFWLSHSVLFPLLAWIFYPHILTLLILLAIGHHCGLDTVSNVIFGKQATGYYTIVLIPSIELDFKLFKIKTKNYRINGRLSTYYLLTNWFISLIILIIVVVM